MSDWAGAAKKHAQANLTSSIGVHHFRVLSLSLSLSLSLIFLDVPLPPPPWDVHHVSRVEL